MDAIAQRAAAPVFALAMFSGAALLFVLQPLFAHMATPLLGGSPAVWNVSMAFFQAALLGGYLYAHLLARLRDVWAQALIHAVVLAIAFLALPVHVTTVFGPPSSIHPALWLMGVLTVSAGAPFAAISATAPLLQSWYARTGRADAHDPYYLYAASNLGSFIGLLAYPVLAEPLLGVRAQGASWTVGYVFVAAMILAAAAMTLGAHSKTNPIEHSSRSPAPTTNTRLFWVAAAAIPSALILGVTLHISTDVASAPLLWVVPLALYLTTFVIAFSRGGEKLAPIAEFVFPFAIAALLACYFSRGNWALALSGNLAGFFFSALLCHLALARARPPADRLTEFYFFVSLGGVLGGAFAAFVAPLIFNDVYEYPLAIAAAALFLPRGSVWMPRITDATVSAVLFFTAMALVLMSVEPRDAIVIAGATGAAAALVASGWGDDAQLPPVRIGFFISAVLFALLMTYVVFNLHSVFQTYQDGELSRFRVAPGFDWALRIIPFLTLSFGAYAVVQPRCDGSRVADVAIGVVIPAAMMLIAVDLQGDRFGAEAITVLALLFTLLALVFNRMRPFVLAGLVLATMVTISLGDLRGSSTITQVRSFFGVLRTRVLKDPANPKVPELRILRHGTTIHGAQLHAPGLSRLPLTYYNPNTSLGEAILAGLNTGERSSLALIGLGAGTTACLTRPTDRMTIFEIDPAVVRLSTTPQADFTYVPECQPHAQVRLGDARLQIAHEPDGAFDVIVVDAFSSDAIPAHLLTREAIALYLRKTSARGIVVLHLSNRNLALVSEAARVAHSLDAPTLFRASDRVNDAHAPFYGGLPASTMIVAKSPDILARLPLASRDWQVLSTPPGRAWSDDYINIMRALWEALDGAEQCRIYPPPGPQPGMTRAEAEFALERQRKCRDSLRG